MVATIDANWLYWLENTFAATAIRQSAWLYPGLEIIHIVGIVLVAGAAFLFDLRLLGFAKNLPITDLAQYLLPWSRRGLFLVIPSGFLLFISNAEELGYDPTFWLKMLLLLVAGLNAAIFHLSTFPSATRWNINIASPIRAKIAGILSIVLWLTIIACGRLLAY